MFGIEKVQDCTYGAYILGLSSLIDLLLHMLLSLQDILY